MGPDRSSSSITRRDPTRTASADIVYTAGKWEFTPGVTLTEILGPLGAPVAYVPSAVAPMVSIEMMASAVGIERARIHGTKTAIAADAAAGVRYVTSFQVGDSLLDRAALVTAIAALTPAGDATPGLYEFQLTAPATEALRRVWPAPLTISDQTDVLMAAADAADFFIGAPGAGDTASIYFAVESAIEGGFEADLAKPAAELVRITCMTDIDLGNAYLTVECDQCVAIEPTVGSERAAVNNLTTTYHVLGGAARVRHVEFSKQLAGVAGVA